MTNKEVFITKSGLSGNTAELELTLVGLNPVGVFDHNNKCLFYKALLSAMARSNAGVSSITEGGYSVSYDKKDRDKVLYDLALESECKELINKYRISPTIEDKSYLW